MSTLLIIGIALVRVVVGGVAAGGLDAIAVLRASRDLAALRPVSLGCSSPVLGTGGSWPLKATGWRAFPRVALPARQPWRGRFMVVAKG